MTLRVEDADEFGCTAYTAEAVWEDGPGLNCWVVYDITPDPPASRYGWVMELMRDEIARQESRADDGRW